MRKNYCIAICLALMAFGCQPRSKEECRAAYKRDKQACEMQDNERMQERCHQIADPVERERCVRKAQRAARNSERDEEECRHRARESRKRCEDRARN